MRIDNDLGIVTHGTRLCKCMNCTTRLIHARHSSAIAQNGAVRRETCTSDLIVGCFTHQIHIRNTHFIRGERASLVRTYHACRAKRLNTRQVPYNGIFARHFLRA